MALDPCDEVRQHPALYGWRDDGAAVSLAHTVRPSGWRRPLVQLQHSPTGKMPISGDEAVGKCGAQDRRSSV